MYGRFDSLVLLKERVEFDAVDCFLVVYPLYEGEEESGLVFVCIFMYLTDHLNVIFFFFRLFTSGVATADFPSPVDSINYPPPSLQPQPCPLSPHP